MDENAAHESPRHNIARESLCIPNVVVITVASPHDGGKLLSVDPTRAHVSVKRVNKGVGLRIVAEQYLSEEFVRGSRCTLSRQFAASP